MVGSCGGDWVVAGALRGVGEAGCGNKAARQGWACRAEGRSPGPWLLLCLSHRKPISSGCASGTLPPQGLPSPHTAADLVGSGFASLLTPQCPGSLL